MSRPEREPRILVVSNMWPLPEDPSFGIFVAQQVSDLRQLGLEVDVFFVNGRHGKQAYLRGILELRRRLGAHPPDLVHAHHVLSGFLALLAGSRRGGRRLMVTHHGIEVFEGWQAPLARFVSRRADHSLVVSAAMATRLGLPPEAVLPCGIDLRDFGPGNRAAAREELGLPSDPPLVAWVGADRPEKRLVLARETVARLRQVRPEVELHVVSGLPPEAVPRHLRACDALLLTSTREGSPMVVKEALAVGLPVVSTDVGDVRELLEGLPGCSICEGLPAPLAAGLDAALDAGPVDGVERLASYDREAVARRLAGLYRKVWKGNQTSRP